MNKISKLIFRSILAAAGLALYGVGLYCTIQANIGVAPWDSFYLGLSETFDVQYGNIAVTIAIIVICIDLLLKERIGIGTILDAAIVGKVVDLCNWIDFIQPQESMLAGILCMLAGLVLNGLGQLIYMKTGLCCGPRDGLLMGISKRMKRVPIGIVSNLILFAALIPGYLLGGPIGIGTIVSVICTGPIMQGVFHLFKFDPKAVKHESLIDTVQNLRN